MILHTEMTDKDLRNKIKQKRICWGGNRKLKIYGTLSCASGKRLKKENRVFFYSENEAMKKGYRPCRHCMKEYYQRRKHGFI